MLVRLRIETLAQFGACDAGAKMTAGAHLAIEPAACGHALLYIKVSGHSDTAGMYRDRTIAEAFQQRIDRLCVRRVGRDIINTEIDECGRKDEQKCCPHTEEIGQTEGGEKEG